MAVGLGPLPTLHPVAGFELGIASAGIKRPGRKDVVVMRCAEGSTVAGVFTLNAFCAAPVILAKQRVAGTIRYLLTNTGNANAGTGEPGLAAAERTCAKLAELTGVDASLVLPYSTGVIGEPLPVEKIEGALQAALDDLSVNNWEAAATGIMTTDTLPKGASRQFEHEGVTITVTGISKGAGMIRPNMATMLGYIATDAKVAAEVLQDLVRDAANKSFNRITIDGDTSTNDSFMLIATGAGTLVVDSVDSAEYAALAAAGPDMGAVWAKVFQRPGAAESLDVDEDLYGGFVGNNDRRRLTQLIALDPDKLAEARTGFEDERLEELVFRYKARNFPDILNDDEQERWYEHCSARLQEGEGGARSLEAFYAQLNELSKTADAKGMAVLAALK